MVLVEHCYYIRGIVSGAYAMYPLSPYMVAASDARVRVAKRILALSPRRPPARRGSEISHRTRGVERQAVKRWWPTLPQPRTSQKSYGWQVLLDGSKTDGKCYWMGRKNQLLSIVKPTICDRC